MAESNFNHDTCKTLKVEGLGSLLKEKLIMHYQSGKNNGGDVKNVFLFPECDEDSVLIEFEDPKGTCKTLASDRIDLVSCSRHRARFTANQA